MYELKCFPCTAKKACLYATHLAKGLAPVSIRNYLSAVWYKQKMYGFQDFSSDFMLSQTLNGIERAYDYSTHVVKYPLKPIDLLNMYKLLDMNVLDDVLFWVAALVCFRGLLRVCHVTNSPHNLRVGNVTVHQGYVEFRITSSKSDQFGKKTFSVIINDIVDSPLCISTHVKRLLKGASKKDFLLCHVVGGIRFPMDYSYVNCRLQLLAQTVNLPVNRISTHCFRHGGATMLKDLDLPVSSIMIRGNWRSSAVHRYLHQSTRELLKMEQIPCSYMSGLI